MAKKNPKPADSTIEVEKAAKLILLKDKGDVKSLAIAAIKAFEEMNANGNSKSLAWDFSRSVQKTYGKDFTQANAREHFKKSFINGKKLNLKAKTTKPLTKTNNTKDNKNIDSCFDKAAINIIKDTQKPKNEKIRELLSMDYGISLIANELDLKYQRVKNIKKMMDRNAMSNQTGKNRNNG